MAGHLVSLKDGTPVLIGFSNFSHSFKCVDLQGDVQVLHIEKNLFLKNHEYLYVCKFITRLVRIYFYFRRDFLVLRIHPRLDMIKF